MNILALVLSMLQIAPEIATEIIQTVHHARQGQNASNALAAVKQLPSAK